MKLGFSRIAFLGALPLLLVGVGAGACGSTDNPTETSTTTTGTGAAGGGGAGGTADTASSSSATTSTTGSGGAGGKPDNGMPSTDYPAPHPGAPYVITYGGPVLAHPKLIQLFFSNDAAPIVAKLKDFGSKIGGSAYWAASTAEYGVGPATHSSIDLAEAAPSKIDDEEIQTWLANKIYNDPTWPAPDANTVYVINYPDGTSVTSSGSAGCQEYLGYHANITLDAAHGGKDVAYAVVPRCSGFGMGELDTATTTLSHEMIEASTDPYPFTDPAYAIMDTNHIFWLPILGGGETSDMCSLFDASYDTFPDLPYLVQLSWSNKAAKAGHDPCVPNAAVYFNAAPVLKDTVMATIYGQQVPVKGVKIPVGETKDVEIDLFSDGDTGGPWTVDVSDASAIFGGPSHLDFSLDRETGQNGEKLHLSITVKSAGTGKSETFIVSSTLNGRRNIWIGIVGN